MKKLLFLSAIVLLLSGISAEDYIKLQTSPIVITNMGNSAYIEEKNIIIEEKPVINESTPIANNKEEPVITQNPLLEGMQGNVGRIILPSVGYEMPLYNGSEASWSSIVDANNSALYTNYLGKMMVADHAYQGFSAMKQSPIGSIGYIVQGNQIITIRCVSIYQATNTGNGIMVGSTYADEMSDGSIFMYTCNDSTGVSVTVSFWVYV